AGTSYSTPAAAAAAAIVRQYFMEGWYPSGRPVMADAITPSAALIRAVLIASGVPVTGSGTVSRGGSDTWPNNEQGFGRVLLSNVLPLAATGDTFRTQVVDETAGLLTGDAPTYTFHVATPGPVKLVLTWSDFPGTLDASYGGVTRDRVLDAAGDTGRLDVQDSSATSLLVHVASGIEPAGEDGTFTGGHGVENWRASIRTALGTPVTDGFLQVREGDT